MKQNRSKFLKIYIFPIATLVVFVGIIIFLVIPRISSIFEGMELVNQNNISIKNIEQEVSDLSTLQNNPNLRSDLDLLNNIASNGATRVVEFRDKIAGMLSSFSLAINAQRISESSFINADIRDSIILIEIPFEFTVGGSLENIKAFITSLSTLDDFAIVKELGISKGENEAWVMNIILVKYQFAANPNDDDLYSSIDPTSRIPQNIRDFLDLKK